MRVRSGSRRMRMDSGYSLVGSGGPRRGGIRRFRASNPANGEDSIDANGNGARDVDEAVACAGIPSWSKSGYERARVLYALGRLIQKHSRFFAVLESLDNGKPIRETRDLDIPLAARHFTYHAGWAQLAGRELADHEPLGVVGQIIPWNFPLLMLAAEDRAGIGRGQLRGAQAGGGYQPHGALLRRPVR